MLPQKETAKGERSGGVRRPNGAEAFAARHRICHIAADYVLERSVPDPVRATEADRRFVPPVAVPIEKEAPVGPLQTRAADAPAIDAEAGVSALLVHGEEAGTPTSAVTPGPVRPLDSNPFLWLQITWHREPQNRKAGEGAS